MTREIEVRSDKNLAHSHIFESVKRYAESSKAENTRLAYQKDWTHFEGFCGQNDLPVLPSTPEAVILYITSLADAGKKYSTIQRRLVSISQIHKLKNYDSPITSPVKEILKGIGNEKGKRKTQKKALVFSDIAELMKHEIQGNGLKALRDRAMILLGYAGFLRRSELCNLQMEHIEFNDSGLLITLPRTKTGHDQVIAIEKGTFITFCPVANLKRWLDETGIDDGFIFRRVSKSGRLLDDRPVTTHGFVYVLKQYCFKVGINPEKIAGHSLRAGGATQASLNKANDTDIKKHGRWKSDVYHEYIRKADLFKNNPSGKLGL